MDITRIKQVVAYGWQHAGEISKMIENGEPTRIRGKLSIFFDILRCYRKYSLWSNQYKKDKFYNLSDVDRHTVGIKYHTANKKKAEWTDYFYENKRFFAEWCGEEHDFSFKKAAKRNMAYQQRYGLGDKCIVRSKVLIMSTHGRIGQLSVGSDCMFGRNADIDYTGGLTIEDGVKITEDCIIMTHNHDIYNHKKRDVVETPLVIRDNVMIGARSTILPGTTEIGRHAMISVGAVVRNKVPPYSVVMGNPAKVVGFKWTPQEILKYEADNYSVEDRLPLELLEKNYQKYFLKRIKEIKEFTKI